MKQHKYHSKKWFRRLCVLFALFVVITARGDVFASSTSSTYYGTVIQAPRNYAYAPSIINDNGLYKMWFGADFSGYSGDQICYAESSNGTSWGTPIRVMGPTAGALDWVHTCDPSVVIKTENAPRNSAYASSNLSGWEPSKTIDGSTSTSWSSNYHSSAYNTEWLELRFGSTIGINAIKLTPRTPNGYCFPVNFKLQYYDGSWHDISGQSYTNYTNPGTTPQEFKFPTVKGSRVRLYVTKLGVDQYNNHYCQMAEISATKATFYMWYTATEHYLGMFNQIFLATSYDGKNWTKYGSPTPVIPISNYGLKTLADFENGVDSRMSFASWNYGYSLPTALYAWTNPPDGSEATDDINYWDVKDDGNGSDGLVDAYLNLSGSDRNWSSYNNILIKLYAWSTRGQNCRVQIWAHNAGTGQYHSLGTHNLAENTVSELAISISGISNRSNIDRIQFRVWESYFSNLQTSTNKQRTHIFGVKLSKTPYNYSIGQSSVLYKDGYFWQFFTDFNGASGSGVARTYLARSTDGINWTRQNGGYSVFAKTCTDVKYLSSANKYYMVYGEVDDNKIYWNISSSMTSWPAHSSSRTINVDTNNTMNHNPGLLGDGQGYMSTSSKAYYGAGSSWGVWDIDMSNLTIYP